MIGGEAFLLLKTGSNGPGSSEQAEIPLAGFATILAFGSWGPFEGSVDMTVKVGKMHSMIEPLPNSIEYG
jgi:hypothetical protein